MYDFDTLKAGDMLLTTARRFGADGFGRSPFAMTEWVELTVDKVTPKFYSVDGEKYAKSQKGNNFMRRHYIPGQCGAPECGNTDEFELKMALYGKLRGLMPNTLCKLEKLPLQDAAAFADRIKLLDAEIDAAVAGK